MEKTIKEAEDGSIESMLYQGKPLSLWEKEFEGEFNARQLFLLIRSGVDLGRIKLGLVDEAGSIDDKALFKDEEFFFERDGDANIRDYVMPNISMRVYTADTDDPVYTARMEPTELEIWIVPYIALSNSQQADTFARNMLPSRLLSIKNPLRAYIYVDDDRLSTNTQELKLLIKDVLARILRVKNNTYRFRNVLLKLSSLNEVDDEMAALDEDSNDNVSESARTPDDVVTVEDFIELLRLRVNLDDRLVFRTSKKEATLFDVNSRAGTTIIDIVPSSDARRLNEDIELGADETIEEFMTVDDLRRIGEQAYKNNKDAWMLDNIAVAVNGKVYDLKKIRYARPEGFPSNGTFFLMDGTDASADAVEHEKSSMMNEKENEDVKQTNEGYNWRNGGYGGTGRSYSSYRRLDREAPRGAAIGWYDVDQLDPKAKGKMPKWRCGPSNFPFVDLFFPNRKYKIGTMVMRNKYVKAGSLSGEIYIAIPSYFQIVKDKNQKGLDILNQLGIPLDLTFGMDPNDDYSMTYVEKK